MPDDSIEEWRSIERAAGHYEVSNWGRVRRAVVGGHNTYVGRLLKPFTVPAGYLHVSFFIRGRTWKPSIHTLVAAAFHGPPPTPRHQVNHIDAVKTNNHTANLEWSTPVENTAHAFALGLRWGRKGEANNRARLTERQVRIIRELVELGDSDATLARLAKVDHQTIRDIRTRRYWKHIP